MNLPLNISALAIPLPTASPQFINLYDAANDAPPGDTSSQTPGIAQELRAGLLKPAASLSPKFLYNEMGSKLFEAITKLDEYYPTRTEAAIFEASSPQMAQTMNSTGIRHACLIDLGAGNCAKAAALIPHLQPRQYVPVDISVDFLRDAAEQMQNTFPALDIVGVGMDFSSGLVLPKEVQTQERVFFYPGSSLGNFHPDEALQFLTHIADPAQGKARGLLLGIDLVKDTATLEAAYDDALGVTASFNKNMLLNVNDIIGSDFDVRQWKHIGLFDTGKSRIEMHLEAMHDLTVTWPGHQGSGRAFKAGERIHTECSYKYTLESMTAMLQQAGFRHMEHWTDPKGWFAVFWAAV
ncbi:MAG: L-histidine N(alpha)-methyltransferase [Pseudomonadota bacterium]